LPEGIHDIAVPCNHQENGPTHQQRRGAGAGLASLSPDLARCCSSSSKRGPAQSWCGHSVVFAARCKAGLDVDHRMTSDASCLQDDQ